MTVEEIQKRVFHVVCNQLQVSKDEVTLESKFVEDLGADSLDLTELAVGFEDEFLIEIPDSDFGKLSTVAGTITYLQTRLA